MLVALARPAQAWTLAYEVPAGCDDADAFRARAAAQRARDADVQAAQVRVRAWLASDGRWRLHLEVDLGGSAPGVRELDGITCREVTDAAALIVAFSLDSLPVAAAAPPPGPPRRVPPARDPEPLAVRASAPPVWGSLALAGGVDSGTLPAAAPGLRGDLSLGWRRASLVLGVVQWARVQDTDATGKGMSAIAWQAHVTGRVRVWRGLELGGSLEIGQLDAVAVGVDTVIPRTIGWQGAGGALLWRGPLGHDLEFIIETDVLWPFVRPSFIVDGETRFSPGLCARLWTGVGWRFF